MNLPDKYNAEEIEKKWMNFWVDNKIFKFDVDNVEKEIFSIDTPPPTVSGKMHMGHAFGNSQQDFIARYKRMKGFNVLQPLGTDDNGLPTKLLVEKSKKVNARLVGRKEFRKLCLDTLNNELKPSYIGDWKRLGISCDYDITYSTIDPHCRKISQKSFIDLYNKGREYRQEAPAMFCPKCQTAISQVECTDENIPSYFNDIVFKVDGEELIIATTRPELLPACVAVFYHPSDARYKHLFEKTAKVPLFDIEVPILEDERVSLDKGTGIVMCCTFGDQTDMEWQKQYQLPIKEAFGKDGKMTSLAEKYEGLEIVEARKAMIEDMKNLGLLKASKPITHAVNVHERCGTPVEFIHSKQWFIRYLDLKEEMEKWGEEFEWLPSHMKNRYDNWVKGLAWDWCISRQLPFGIPFPVWYCKDCGEVIIAKEENLPLDPVEDKCHLDKCPNCGCNEFVPEEDVLNTWATSSLTPTIVKELLKETPIYEKIKDIPMNLRPQGHDIISFWLFNTVVKSKLHYNLIPWEKCFINGWMLDSHGKKMSKSKGNIIEPREMIEKYGADSLRYMAASSKLGDDLPFPEKDIITGKKTVTKLFNAAKFSLMNLEDYKSEQPEHIWEIDKWILTKFNEVVKNSTDYFEAYEFSKSKFEVDNFFWNVFCDYYLEMVKDRVYKVDIYGQDAKISAQFTLEKVLLGILKLYAPFIPFVTEEIYSWYFKENEKESIHLTNWPEYEVIYVDENSKIAGNLACEIIGYVRKVKSENKLSQKTEIKAINLSCSEEMRKYIELVENTLKMTLNAQEINFVSISDNLEIEVKLE
ncbi:MAG: valine--tRNA ligase [Candidatus Woesearchaeota archaeon]